MIRQEGDYILAVGGKWGAVYTGHKWHRYDCVHCTRHLLKRRIGTNDSPTASKIARDHSLSSIVQCHCKAL